MIIDYNDKQLILTEEDNESFVDLQDITKFDFCTRVRKQKYQIPFVSLPILIKCLKQLKYKINYTNRLKVFYNEFKADRKHLEECKEGKSKLNEVKIIKDFLNKESEIIRKKIPNFKLYESQIDTIIFGIIGKRIIIGNDIGTGKTLTSIMISKYLLNNKRAKKVLILLPASLATNFYADYNKFFNDGKMLLISGKDIKKKRIEKYKLFKKSSSLEFLITNYEKCRVDYNELNNLDIDVIIVDEFHKMKNFLKAKMSINFFKLIDNWKPEYRYPMSGSPIENNLFDLYPIFKLLDDGFILGGKNFFEKNFIIYEEKQFYVKTKNGRFLTSKLTAIGFKNHTFLKKLIKPFVIRKKLKLPVGLYRDHVMFETPKVIFDGLERIRGMYIDNFMKCYMQMRMFLCNTELYDVKLNLKLEYLKNLIEQTSSKIIVFSFFRNVTDIVGNMLKKINVKYIATKGGDGQDPLDVVNQFNNNPEIKVLITTDKINYGMNITSAKWIIHFETPNKISTLEQREGRAYRLGQTEDVHSITLNYKNTVEEIILNKTLEKEKLIKTIVEDLASKDKEIQEVDNDLEKEILKEFKRKYNFS